MEGFEQHVAKDVGGEGLDAMVAGFYKRVKEDGLRARCTVSAE